MMKKILLMAALICGVLGFNSCSEDKEDPITVSISGTSYTLPNEDGASVTITATTSAPMRSNVTVPFTISGGTQGSDYKLSAEAFNFKTGESSASIEVSRANATAQLSLTLNLGTPSISDVLLGTVNYCTITVVGSNIYTFSDSNDKLAMDKSIAIELETASGSSFSYASAIEIPIEVVASGTTAEEGTHYKFVDDKKVAKFEAGSSKGYVSLTFLKLESGKDQVTLKVSDSANLYAGNNPTIRIKIVGPTDFSGIWAYEKITNEAWLLSNMGTPALSTIITGNENDDQFTLDGDNGNYKFVPNFKGKLKNYFTAEGKAVANGVRKERLQEEGGLKPPTKELTVLDIENINLNMSETDKTIGKYSVAVSIVRNDDGEERLWMTIYQYRPTENTVYGDWGMTWKDIVEMMDYDSYDGDPNSMETSPIRIYFKRVQE